MIGVGENFVSLLYYIVLGIDWIMDHVIGGKFKLGRKIGSGSFGELYLGMHSFTYSIETMVVLDLFILDLGLCVEFP